MIEHPVPQNITSYEFRLVGSMTLKQFFELMAGVVMAYATYRTNLFPLIKWPIVILFVVFGVAMAFVPIEERPLDQWFWAFIRAIYNPTKFYWRRSLKAPEVFSADTTNVTRFKEQEDVMAAAVARKRSRAEAYLQTLDTSRDATSSIDVAESSRTSGILALFDEVRVPMQSIQITPMEQEDVASKPDLQLRPRSLRSPIAVETVADAEAEQPTAGLQPAVMKRKEYSVEIPTVLPVVLAGAEAAAEVPVVEYKQEQAAAPSAAPLPSQALPTSQPIVAEEVKKSETLPFPNPPKQPNVLAGMVLDSSGKLLENAIIEIRTEQGVPVRAIKSNKLGQFFTSSPLPSGTYQVIVEKTGYLFDPNRLTVENKVIAPLEIWAKQAVQ